MTSAPLTRDDSRPNPQKRNILLNRLVKAPWWLLVIALFVVGFAINASQSQVYRNVWREVRQGIWITLWVTVVAYLFAMVFGLLIAMMRRSNNFFIYQISTVYVEFVRGIPTLVLVYYVVLALTPMVPDVALKLDGDKPGADCRAVA
ncbi:MAG: ABC transporter permease subunit, partial [Chloroflexota bacterium]